MCSYRLREESCLDNEERTVHGRFVAKIDVVEFVENDRLKMDTKIIRPNGIGSRDGATVVE